MSMMVWELQVQDTETGIIYRTGYKFDHSRIADDVDSYVSDVGGIDEAIQAQILEDTRSHTQILEDSEKTKGIN